MADRKSTGPFFVTGNDVAQLNDVFRRIQQELDRARGLSGTAEVYDRLKVADAVNLDEAVNVRTARKVSSGGTGITAYARGDLLYAIANDTLERLGIGAANTVFRSDGSGPSWGSVVLADLEHPANVSADRSNSTDLSAVKLRMEVGTVSISYDTGGPVFASSVTFNQAFSTVYWAVLDGLPDFAGRTWSWGVGSLSVSALTARIRTGDGNNPASSGSQTGRWAAIGAA